MQRVLGLALVFLGIPAAAAAQLDAGAPSRRLPPLITSTPVTALPAESLPARFAVSRVGSAGRSVSRTVKWGVVIGGVTGATVGAILVFGHQCHNDGWECILRPVAGIFAIGVGAGVGMLVGGSIGRAIDRSR
jgi:hypothetical protein